MPKLQCLWLEQHAAK